MKRFIIATLACLLASAGVYAQTLLSIDFENPPYVPGNLAGQEMWTIYPGTAPLNAVTNANPAPAQGTQCALLVATNGAFAAVMFDMSNYVNNATFNTNTHNLRVTVKVWGESLYNGIDLRDNIYTRNRMELFSTGTNVASLYLSGFTVPVAPGAWHEMSVLMDCKTRKAIEFTVNSQIFPVNVPFVSGTAPYPQMIRINTDGTGNARSAFDAIKVSTEKKAAIELLKIDFEDPPYVLGDIIGQGMWTSFPGYAPPSNSIINANPTPAEGAQCAALTSTNGAFTALVYDMSAAVNSATFNTNTHNLRVSFDMYAESFYTAIAVYDNVTDLRRISLLGIWGDVANAYPGAINEPVDNGKWVHITADFDSKIRQLVKYTVNGKAFYPNINFENAGALNIPQMLRISTDASSNGRGVFDNIIVAAVPKPYYVSPDGDDGADGLTPATAFATFDMAMEMAEANDTIRALAGVYTNPYTSAYGNTNLPARATIHLGIKRSGQLVNNVSLEGAGPTETIFRYVNALPTSGAIRRMYAMGQGTKATGFKMEGEFPGDSDYSYAIYFLRITNALIENVWVEFPTNTHGWSGFGCNWDNSIWHPVMRNCLINGGALGVRDRHWAEWTGWAGNNRRSHELIILNNTFVNQLKHTTRVDEGAGVQIQNNRGAYIYGNIFDNCEKSAIFLNTSAGYPSNDIMAVACMWNNCPDGFITQFNESKNVIITQEIVEADALLAEDNGYAYSSPYGMYGWHKLLFETPVVRAPEPWPLNGNNPQHQGYYTGGTALTKGAIVWTNSTQIGPFGAGIWGSGVADEDTLYINVDPYNAGEYELLALNLSDGTLKYGVDLEQWGNGTPAVSDTMILAADNAGYAYGINKANGVIVWKTQMPGAGANGGVMLNNNRMYVEHNGGLTCLNADKGNIHFTTPFVGDAWSGNGPALSIDGSTAYIRSGNNNPSDIMSINADNGQVNWSYPVQDGWGDLEPIVGDDGRIYCGAPGLIAGDANDHMLCLNSDGTLNWDYDFGLDGVWWHGGYALSEDGATVYCARRNGVGITALNTSDGSLKWDSTGIGDTLGGCVVGAGNIVMSCFYGIDTNATIHAIQDNGAQGDVLWSIILPVGGGSWSWPTLLPNGDLIVESDAGLIVRVTLGGGVELAPEPWPLNGNGPQRQGNYTAGLLLDGGAIVWTNSDLVGIGIWGSGVCDTEAFYINTDENPGELKKIDLATGATIWNADLQDWANGTPALANDQVFCSDNAGYAYSVDKATGSSIWEVALGGTANGGTLLYDSKVYVEAAAVGLFCLNASDGVILWTNVQATADQGWQGNGPSINQAGDTVYYTAGGVVVAVDVMTGNTVWTNVFGTNTGWQDEKEPIVDDSGNLYAGLGGLTNETDNDILVSMQSDGTIRWIYEFAVDDAFQGGGYALSADNSTIYYGVGNDQGGIIAINTADGTLKWNAGIENTKGGCVVAAGSTIVGVYQVAGNAVAKGIRDDGASATVVWSVPLNVANDSWSWPTILANGDVIVEAENGVIARITVPEPALFGLLAIGLLMLIRRK